MSNKRTIYIAGASTEAQDVAVHADRLVRAGWVITHRWWATIGPAGHVAGQDRELPTSARLALAEEDLAAVMRAGYLWLLVPRNQSSGAWIEFGAAITHARLMAERKRIIISGDWERTIFAELADKRFGTHALAGRWLAGGAR